MSRNPTTRRAFFAALLLLGSAASTAAGAACAQRQQAPAEGGALGSELSLLSWNIQKLSNAGWDRDLRALAADSELVMLQEAVLDGGIAALLPGTMDRAFAPGYIAGSDTTGVMTLGAAAPSRDCQFAAMEPWLRTPKAALVTEYALDGRADSLLAINLHGVNFSFGVSALEAQLAELAGLLAEHEGPAVVAGDLNTWSASRQRLVDQFMREHGLNPVRFEPDHRSRPLGRALDHIYLRGLRATAAEVVPVGSSDHNPLRVQLAVE
ncbi:MAG: endonuclease/exonuclease/phosphatase family protein [Halieaceae bacterium]|jgi:endonuclease/exonuclease/phosphatase (EEP) superfamily protein YafD|nr:endonuclease/exonuclease/phosphatase family protein [Halieaceae bacterium]